MYAHLIMQGALGMITLRKSNGLNKRRRLITFKRSGSNRNRVTLRRRTSPMERTWNCGAKKKQRRRKRRRKRQRRSKRWFQQLGPPVINKFAIK